MRMLLVLTWMALIAMAYVLLTVPDASCLHELARCYR